MKKYQSEILEIQNTDIWGDNRMFCDKRSQYILELGENYTLDDLYQRLIFDEVISAEKMQAYIKNRKVSGRCM